MTPRSAAYRQRPWGAPPAGDSVETAPDGPPVQPAPASERPETTKESAEWPDAVPAATENPPRSRRLSEIRDPAPPTASIPDVPVRPAVAEPPRGLPRQPAPPGRQPGGAAPLARPPRWAFSGIIDECVGALASLDAAALRSIGVTSCNRGDGRTVIATALAVANRCDYRSPTILAELDLASPSLAGRLDLQPSPGVAEILRGEAAVKDCIQTPFDNLGVLVAGNVGDNPAELITQLPAADLAAALGRLAEVVVLDLPPIDRPGAAVQMAQLCAQLILVVRAGGTPMEVVRQTVEPLQPKPLVILNRIVRPGPKWLNRMFGGGR